MELASLIPSDVIIEELTATGKEAALEEKVRALSAAGRVDEEEVASLVDALMAREELGSTGIGKGVAVPHAKHEAARDLVGVLARSTGGIEFAALDGQPVRLVFLILSAKEHSGQHLGALARVARLVRDDRFCRFLREAKDAAELADLLAEADSDLDVAGPERS